MRKLYIFGLIGVAALIIGLAWADQMTFTTYYPAPYGVYNQMIVMDKLGVGTTAPVYPLDVAGNTIRLRGGSGGAAAFHLENTADGAGRRYSINSDNLGYFFIRDVDASNAVRMVINSIGNVGIGTPAPVGKLDVVGTDATWSISSNGRVHSLTTTCDPAVWNHYPWIGFYDGTNTRGGYIGYGLPGTRFDIALENGNALAIQGGPVAIGKAIPAADLEVSNTLCLTPTDSPNHAVEGALYYDDSENTPKYHDGTAWKTMGGGAAFGVWQNKANNVVYQAATDGFVVALAGVGAGVSSGYTDNNNPPTTVRAWCQPASSFTMPVRKGDYYKVFLRDMWAIHWIALGN